MRFRFSALLCLAGLAGCSNSTNPSTAREPVYGNDATQAANEPSTSMKPASLEQAPPARTTPTSDEARTTNGPLTADTTGTASDPARSRDEAQKTAAPTDVPPDNTKVNERDTNGAALTPVDQNNNQTDLKITQQVRQAVMADGSLSFTAKNVKIITQGGKVTLRGPVKTEQERSNIEAAARKVAGVAQVDNQLEVKK